MRAFVHTAWASVLFVRIKKAMLEPRLAEQQDCSPAFLCMSIPTKKRDIPMNMKHKILLFFIILLPSSISAENATNVRVRQQGKDIIVSYDLSESSYVQLSMSVNGTDFIPLKEVEGDIGTRVSKGKDRKIIWHPLQEQESFVAENVRFRVVALDPYQFYALPKYKGGKTDIETFILGEIAYSPIPQLSYGLSLGQTYKYGLGWFVDFRSNFNFRSATNSLTCTQGGYIEEELPFYSGRKQSSSMVCHAGLVFDILDAVKVQRNRFNSFGLYVGIGYGWRRLLWETTDGQWVEYSPTSHRGFTANIGLQGSIFGFTLRAGINTIGFKYTEIEAGLGWTF